MRDLEADVVVVGSGVSGALVARELAAAGASVLVLERGETFPWKSQFASARWEAEGRSTAHNHEVDPDGIYWPWQYVYGTGGTLNRWGATSPRFLPEDFEMRSRFGVMQDWPLSYDDLLPYYRRAERALAISGPATELMPGAGFPLDPHPFSPQDRLIAPHLEPFIALPQARPSRSTGGVAACCGSYACQLCPVDAKATVLNRLDEVFRLPGVDLRERTIAARLETDRSGRRIAAVACVDASGARFRARGRRFVVAANGIESAGLLLRSEVPHEETGRWLFDHRNGQLTVPIRSDAGAGRGASLITGASYAYYRGDARRERAGVFLLPYNPGPPNPPVFEKLVDGVLAGHSGRRVRTEATAAWKRTLALDVLVDDVPMRENSVRLSTRRDSFGIPFNRVRFGKPSEYFNRGVRYAVEDLPRRLRPLGAREAKFAFTEAGGHLLGTLRMGAGDDGVVDADLRHRARDNLFVAGGAVFPTYSPTHPTLTVAALAVRLGERLADEE